MFHQPRCGSKVSKVDDTSARGWCLFKLMIRPVVFLVLTVAVGIVHEGGAAGRQVVVVNSGGLAPTAPRPPGTSAISGVVRDGTTGRPVTGAVVTLSTHARLRTPTVDRMATDSEGRFVFTKVAAGDDYHLHVARIGYFDGGYGREGPGPTTGAAVVVADGQWFDRADVELWKPGAVTGRVIDEAGEPLVGVPVRALPLIMLAGVEHVVAGLITTTDDRGAYRLTGLVPGRYLVQVPSVQAAVPAGSAPLELVGLTRAQYENAERAGRAPTLPATIGVDAGVALAVGQYLTPPGAARAYAPTLYPSARSISAAVVIEPEYGRDLTGIDIRVEPVATARVSGQVVGPPDQLAGLVLRLVPPGSEGLAYGAEAATAVVGAGGRFSFVNVPLGTYTLMAGRSVMQYHYTPMGNNLQATLPDPPGFSRSGMGAGSIPSAPPSVGYGYVTSRGEETTWAQVPVAVDAGGHDNLIIELRPTVTVRGRVIWEGGEAEPPRFTRITPTGPVAGIAERLPVYADPADGNAALGLPRGDYTIATKEFSVSGLKVGTYLLRIQGAPTIKSVTWNGRDLGEVGFDAAAGHDFNDVVVTVTNRLATIGGVVRNADGQAVPGSTVIAFPTDRRQWARFGFAPSRLRAGVADSGGAYELSIPAGQYFVMAVDELPLAGWQHAGFLALAAAGAEMIRVDWTEQITRDVVLRSIR
ncbi:MAG TPA: carboxypeptidase-like regulatory domain-containing protein [Vicinamibacterales bacterium]|nr:carboxypeptidase-like regulatory domain-containing protein [Vicinamibacterales bacterium]